MKKIKNLKPIQHISIRFQYPRHVTLERSELRFYLVFDLKKFDMGDCQSSLISPSMKKLISQSISQYVSRSIKKRALAIVHSV